MAENIGPGCKGSEYSARIYSEAVHHIIHNPSHMTISPWAIPLEINVPVMMAQQPHKEIPRQSQD